VGSGSEKTSFRFATTALQDQALDIVRHEPRRVSASAAGQYFSTGVVNAKYQVRSRKKIIMLFNCHLVKLYCKSLNFHHFLLVALACRKHDICWGGRAFLFCVVEYLYRRSATTAKMNEGGEMGSCGCRFENAPSFRILVFHSAGKKLNESEKIDD